jgi:hypothetical protein
MPRWIDSRTLKRSTGYKGPVVVGVPQKHRDITTRAIEMATWVWLHLSGQRIFPAVADK